MNLPHPNGSPKWSPQLPSADPTHSPAWPGEPSPWRERQLGGLVQWQPWGTAALTTARALDRPVLLVVASEGCLPFEQMAAESFADATTAAVMNDNYVCCLADARWHRELDRQLQLVHQLLAGRAGGWPLLALVDPADGRPCFAGTYFPATPTGSLPGFADFLRQAGRHFHRQREPLQEQGQRLATAFAQLVPPPLLEGTPLTASPLDVARRQLETLFDRDMGTFTRGQPVPAAPAASRLLRHWAAGAARPEPDLQALFMATLALTKTLALPLAPSADALRNGPDAGLPSLELVAFAAAAAATGEPAFREAAESGFAALLQLGLPTSAPLPAVEDWHRLRAMALAARWGDRPDWLESLNEQATRCRAHHPLTTTSPLAGLAAALAATLALLELRWSDEDFAFAAATAAALCASLGATSSSSLPGLPTAPAHADDTLPSAEGMAALALYRMGCLCGNALWQATAGHALRGAWRPMSDTPATHLALLDALEEQTLGLETLVIRGPADEAARWSRALARWYAPARQVFAIPAGAPNLPFRLSTLATPDNDTNAWLFTGETVHAASTSLEQLTRELRDRLHRG